MTILGTFQLSITAVSIKMMSQPKSNTLRIFFFFFFFFFALWAAFLYMASAVQVKSMNAICVDLIRNQSGLSDDG